MELLVGDILHEEVGELPGLLGRAVDDGRLAELGDLLVGGALQELARLRQIAAHQHEDGRGIRVVEIAGKHGKDIFRELVCPMDDHEPEGIAHRHPVEAHPERFRVGRPVSFDLIQIEGGKPRIEAGLDARERLVPLHLIGAHHQIGWEQLSCLCHVPSLPRSQLL